MDINDGQSHIFSVVYSIAANLGMLIITALQQSKFSAIGFLHQEQRADMKD